MSDALTPLRRAYGVEAPGDIRALAAPGSAESAVEAALFSQGRTALNATVAAQDRRPSASVLEAVLAEAAQASAQALAPLAAVRALYHRLPARTAPAAVRADVPAVEAAILAQTRAAVEQTVDGRTQSPSAVTLAAVSAYAASATRLAARPDAPVEAADLWPLAIAYGLPTTFVSDAGPVEIPLLIQTRALLDAAPAEHVSEASVAAVVARAAEASRLAPVPDAAVAPPALAALAVAYGLPLAASAGTPGVAETVLLVQTRGLLDAAPAAGGPSGAALAAVAARAAGATMRPEADRPLAARPAADREPVRAVRPSRRVGAWSSAAVAALALVVFFFPRSAGAPEVPGAPAPAPLATAALAGDATEPSVSEPSPDVLAPDTGALVASAAPASSSAFASPGAPATPPPASVVVAAERAPIPVPTSRATGSPSAARPIPQPTPAVPRAVVPREEVRPVAAPDPATALASVSVSRDAPLADDEAWEAQGDVRVLSLRLQELRRGNEGIAWDTPTEAFGAPTTRSAFSAPGIQSVRQTVPAARARLFTVPGDR